MDEALLTQIVALVLKELKKAAPHEPFESKKKLLLLSDDPEKLQGKFDGLRLEFGSEYALYALKEVGNPLPFGIEGVEACEVKRVKWDRVYLANCSVNSLVKISLGLREGLTADLIGIALTKGTPVEMEKPSFGFTPATQEGYRRLLEGYLAQVTSFGVVIRGQAQYEHSLLSAQSPQSPQSTQRTLADQASKETQSSLPLSSLPSFKEPFPSNVSMRDSHLSPSREVHRYEKRLLTEREVNKVPTNSLLLANPGVILTPLAKDVLKLRNIEVRVAEEGCG